MIYLFGLIVAILTVAAGRQFDLSEIVLWLTVGFVLAAAVLARRTAVFSWLFVILIGLLLLARTATVMPPEDFQPRSLDQQQVTVTGRVVNQPANQGKSMTVVIDRVDIKDQPIVWYGRLQIGAPLYSLVRYGDRIEAKGRLHAISDAQTGYERYLVNHQIYAQLRWPTVTVLSSDTGNPLVAGAYWLQQQCQEAIVRLFPRDEAGLLLGIVIGLNQPLSEEFEDALSRTSTTHIIVASGYNASIIVAALLALSPTLGRRKVIPLIFIALAGYVALSGFNPSMIRAAIMASLIVLAQAGGRQRLALHILSVAGGLMLLYNPLWILDTGWQLSFAATAGIIVLEPIISPIINKKITIGKEAISATLAAQIATLPIIAATFGTISLLGLSANILVLWLVPWVMAVGAIMVPLAILAPSLASWLVWLVEPGLLYIKQTILLVASLPIASIETQLPALLWAAYYLGLVLLVWRLPHESGAKVRSA